VDERPVKRPNAELGARVANLDFWQVAGLSQTGALISIRASVDGAGESVTIDHYALAFDPDSELTPIAISYDGVGAYSFSFDAQYPDEQGVDRTLGLVGGIAIPVNGVASDGAGDHTGSNGASTLTDSTKSWDTDELVGKEIFNVTDGSHGTITGNTADTVTATLAGGTDDDWDTDDEYVIAPRSLIGQVHLSSARAGRVLIFDADGGLVDPAAFLLLVW
jgi:hypothetical protein